MSDAPSRPATLRRRDLHRWPVGLALAAALAAAFAVGFLDLPREGTSLPAIARHALAIAQPQWDTTEVVSEVVYGTRGFDTFGETMLLIAAVVSVMTLARSREGRAEYVGESAAGEREQRSQDPGDAGPPDESEQAEEAEEHGAEPQPDPDALPIGSRRADAAEGMSLVVRTAAVPAAVILSVAGVYLAAWGYTPGGGFPAGVIVTGIAILVYVAFGRSVIRTVVRPTLLEPVEMLAGAAIGVVGLIGLVRHGSLFANGLPFAESQTIFAGGNQQLYSALELIEVAVSLTIAVFALLGMGHDWAPDDEEEDESEE
ncbi:MAG TPA: MnhB domain-containing protein [Jatrophihabitans sp.]|jgi:multicomponent Na+:H+ antiporter subunit B|nr:MnhB domain-containing protein [Jatrophihabitans sp.]